MEKENTPSPRTRDSDDAYELLRAEPSGIAQAERKEASKYGAEGRSACGRKLEPSYPWERRTESIRLLPQVRWATHWKHKGVGEKDEI